MEVKAIKLFDFYIMFTMKIARSYPNFNNLQVQEVFRGLLKISQNAGACCLIGYGGVRLNSRFSLSRKVFFPVSYSGGSRSAGFRRHYCFLSLKNMTYYKTARLLSRESLSDGLR